MTESEIHYREVKDVTEEVIISGHGWGNMKCLCGRIFSMHKKQKYGNLVICPFCQKYYVAKLCYVVYTVDVIECSENKQGEIND